LIQEFFYIDATLAQDRAQRPFRHVTGVMRQRYFSAGSNVAPHLVTARTITIESEPQAAQSAGDFTVFESRKSAH
jgi:hypothetical protein